jgi:hypothetical protein
MKLLYTEKSKRVTKQKITKNKPQEKEDGAPKVDSAYFRHIVNVGLDDVH